MTARAARPRPLRGPLAPRCCAPAAPTRASGSTASTGGCCRPPWRACPHRRVCGSRRRRAPPRVPSPTDSSESDSRSSEPRATGHQHTRPAASHGTCELPGEAERWTGSAETSRTSYAAQPCHFVTPTTSRQLTCPPAPAAAPDPQSPAVLKERFRAYLDQEGVIDGLTRGALLRCTLGCVRVHAHRRARPPNPPPLPATAPSRSAHCAL